MAAVVECIPNISASDPETVAYCVSAVSSVEGIRVMNYTSDVDHNRSVITFMGEPFAVEEAAVRLAIAASERIDLRSHSGEHPRVGALDVLPFVPLRDITTEETVELSKRVAKRIWEEAGIPTYLYEDSATAPHRKNLADIRRGGFEGLPEKTALSEWRPDYGEGFHPSAGVTVTGARFFLVAYNFNLTTSELSVAKEIAKKIRESSGGLKGVKALGVMLESENTAQVTVNLVDYRKTSLHTLTEQVRLLARERGCDLKNAELIGLIPQRAIAEAAATYLALTDFDPDTRIIENYLF